jgi:hypothetical protein
MEEEDTKASFPPSRYRFERRLRSLVRASEGTRETDLGAIAGRTRAPAGVSVLRDETQYRTGTGRRGTAVRDVAGACAQTVGRAPRLCVWSCSLLWPCRSRNASGNGEVRAGDTTGRAMPTATWARRDGNGRLGGGLASSS